MILIEVDPAVEGSPPEPYFMAPYPVTLGEYDRFCDAEGRELPPDHWGGDDYPVVDIGNGGPLLYCNWLSREQDLCPCYDITWTYYDHPETGQRVEATFRLWGDRGGYRLPTTQEWLWAARGGLRSRHTRYAGGDDLDEVAWHGGNAGRRAHPVGMKRPNELGLFDMTGNVAEACVAQTDPFKLISQGGAWPDSFERALTLGEVHGWQHGSAWGFRIVRTATAGEPEPGR